ncbi:MAG: MFS transporter [Candidatus Aminicenantes bacterium]|nr:MFS transporter [Candidatus Aminicenantes bacterium]NIM81688.1 MFS transporter [Candidatus Aminicenantes bacterium]NIN21059.1 MFS transporter [Candidatus Aminicenantes bacterium]NIN44881.1 MFS transporter [Candidatus Aminicenantes bacterium]NIN87695.1 MFS transporter [Candidatus Aminicenantes bacterium]
MTEAKKKFQLGNVIIISITHLVHDIYSSFLAPILPLLISKFQLSLSLAGFLSVIGRLPSLLNPIVGILADKISVRYFIIISPSITAVSMSLLGVAPSYVLLAIFCFIMGVSATLFHVPAPVMIKHVAGDRVGKGMSFYMLGGELARTIGPMVILGAVSLWELEGSYRLIPFGIMASLVLYLRVRNIKISEDFKKKEAKTRLNKTLFMYFPFFIILAGITLSRSFMRGALTSFLPTYLNLEKGKDLWISGISLSIIQLAGAAGTFLAGSLSDKIGRKTTLLIICIASPVFMVFFLIVEGILVIPLLVLLGFSLTAATPVLLALVQDLDSDRPAFLNSILMTINFFLAAVGIMVVGLMGDWLGLENTYRVSVVLALAAIPFILKLKSKNG